MCCDHNVVICRTHKMTTELHVVLVSNEGMFFNAHITDWSISPFSNIMKTIHKFHFDETHIYIMVKLSQLILEHILTKANVQYEVMTMSFFDALNIILVMTEVGTNDGGYEEDNTTNPIDDFLTTLTEDDVSTSMIMDADMSIIAIEE